MTAKRFHWDWKTGRMKDTYSDFQATKDMRLIEQSINDACRSYEKQIAKLEKENEQLKEQREKLFFRERDTKNRWRELKQENEELKKQLNRLYNYFVDWHGDIMGANQFSEMWDDVKEDEDWED